MVNFLNATPLPSRRFGGGYEEFFIEPSSHSMKLLMRGGGIFFTFTSIYKPNIKSGFSPQQYFLVDN